MKRILSVAIAISIVITSLCLFSSCTDGTGTDDGRISIIAASFPEYDWVRNLISGREDKVELSLLTENGVDIHSYEPSAADVMKIYDCDMFVYIGGISSQWVTDTLANCEKDIMTVNLMEILDYAVKNEETVSGMESDEDGEEAEPDEHIWLSLKNASAACGAIAERLEKLDEAGKNVYESNLTQYENKLRELDGRYAEAVSSAKHDTVIVCDRFPFHYLTEDYGLTYYAAFPGCSSETQASFRTVSFLSDVLKTSGLSHVITTESSDGKIAQTVISGSGVNADVLVLDSMQSVSMQDIADGSTYLSIAESNLAVLTEALS